MATPKDVAWLLASYARDTRVRIEQAGKLPALDDLRKALEQSLGIEFQDAKGEHFFRSTLVQTLFYGIFSAWVLWHSQNPNPNEKFDWRLTSYYLHIPILQALFYEIAQPAKLQSLGLMNVLDLTGAALARVDTGSFFGHFDQGKAVQYFYEPFLEAYDPDLRKELGVWYTPHEIIHYMVERVDRVLRSELGIADGLADKNVYVLDPACGTAGYPVEVLRRIAQTLQEKGDESLLAYDLKTAATQRVFGFEILSAPFVISHLQIGLLLQQYGAHLGDTERAAVYLTNSLTGWEPPKGPKQLQAFHEFQEERDAANAIKQQTPVLVILGNPPYNAYSGVAQTEEEKDLIRPYKDGLIEQWGIKKFNLDDLYVRFFRLAERRIVNQTGKGIICFISNFSYLGDASYVVMRKRFFEEFDMLWFDSLNGDSRETGKLTPQGKPDPSAFSTDANREGIRVGTAIGLMVRKAEHSPHSVVRFRDYWGTHKRNDLLVSLEETNFNDRYTLVDPEAHNRFSFRGQATNLVYSSWPRIIDFCAQPPSNGLMEKRGSALIDIDRSKLEKRMKMYFDPNVSWDEMKILNTGLTEDAAGFDAPNARKKIQKAENFDPKRIVRYALRPFDSRWSFYCAVNPLWNRPRPTLWAQCWEGNPFLLTRFKSSKNPEGSPFFFSRLLSDDHFLSPDAVAIPFRLKTGNSQKPKQISIWDDIKTIHSNYSSSTHDYLDSIGVSEEKSDSNLLGKLNISELIWYHALAIGFSPAYLSENADGIRQDWPRIPLPAERDTLVASARLGKQVAALLDTETPLMGVTTGSLQPELKAIAVLARVGGGALDPGAGDLALTAGWGHIGQDGAVMPGKGKLQTRITQPGSMEASIAGVDTLDISINEIACWRNIPPVVWNFTVGGYQVIKKWLSYREKPILGRDLLVDEARYVSEMARRIAALVLLQPELDVNYHLVSGSLYPWPVMDGNEPSSISPLDKESI